MIRKLITIHRERCNGCGLCARACHEGAIGMVDGKAVLLREDFCDGLGDCLPACPRDAISFEEREAPAYNQAAVQAAQAAREAIPAQESLPWGCLGSACQSLPGDSSRSVVTVTPSPLGNFPIQLKLVPANAPFFHGANLLIAADCTAYACGDFHNRFMKNKVTLIGCPKLDGVDYGEKLTAILQENDIQNVTVVRMEVPCCGGLSHAVKTALQRSGKRIPRQIVTVSTDGRITDQMIMQGE